MTALTVSTEHFNFSLAFDGFTIYPKFHLLNSVERFFLSQGLAFCEATLRANEELELCDSDIVSKSDFDRNIHREDSDHSLYHRDLLPKDDSHIHVKFKMPMTRDKLVIVLDAFVSNDLISRKEKSEFLINYDARNNSALQDLNSSLSGRDINTDTKKIINYIHKCEDEDILSYLSQQLLGQNYDYLRSITTTSLDYQWQGTDREGKLVETSKQWAMIQKALSLQLAHNIEKQCDSFTSAVAQERATELKNSHSFFALKRKSPTLTYQTSSMFNVLSANNENAFNRKYDKHFSKYDVTDPVAAAKFRTR